MIDCSDCFEMAKERQRLPDCDSCPINWFNKEAEAMGFSTKREKETTGNKD